LRCLIIALLAAGFARPFLKHDLPTLIAPTIPQSVVAVLDDSASMNREGLWDAAKTKINDLVATLDPADQFVLMTTSGGATELISREQWQQTPAGNRAAFVRGVLANHEPGWGAKNLDSTIEDATSEWEHMTEAANAATHKRIVVVSDFTASAHVAGLAGLDWPKGCQVDLESVAPAHTGDAGLQWLGWSATDADTGPTARVRIVQSAQSTATAMTVQLRDARSGDAIGDPQKVTVPAGDSQIVLVPVPEASLKNPLRIDLAGDQENFDNTVWAVRAIPRQMTLNYYGAETAGDVHHARYYLERAVAGWKDPVVQVRDTETPAAPDAAQEISVINKPLDAPTIAQIHQHLEAGEFALVLLNDPAMADTAAALVGESGWTALTPKSTDAMFGQIDFQHPLFSLFADPRYSDFTHIHFWHPQSITLPEKSTATVVARFDDGSPAVMEAPVGRGRVIIWGGDWEPGASQWVLSTKFVPWLQSLFERAAGGAQQAAVAEVGDAARLLGSQPAQWRPLAEADKDSAFVATAPAKPGIYQVKQGDQTRFVALEVPAAASNIAPLPLDTWEKLGVPLHAKAITAAAPLPSPLGQEQTAANLESRQKLWRWALLGAAILLALESIYSLALARHPDHNPPEATA
jgi:hypothetical protein